MRNKLFIIILSLLIISLPKPNQVGKADTTPAPNCRFGLTAPYGLDDYGSDITLLRISGFLDWGIYSGFTLPTGVDYLNVLRVGDDCQDPTTGHKVSCSSLPDPRTPYQITLANLPAEVSAHRGMVWVIGNEPDAPKSPPVQDDLTAKEYANRYFNIATQIRALDPTAKLGFGAVVQMTPIRMRYLAKALSQLAKDAGSQAQASSLIDVWTPHAFLLNEEFGGWGAGVPPGFENDHADAIRITNFASTYNIDLFSSRVKSFRSWMKAIGQQNKPLWITEYGSLFPPINAGGSNNVTVSDDKTSAYMLKTFDFLLNTADPNTGFPDDNNQLVQRWFWYSLNDYRYHMGGSLFDPSSQPTPTITTVGTAFLNYTSAISANPEFHFSGNIVLKPDSTDGTKFLVDFSLRNAGNSVTQSPRFWVYQDNPNVSPYAQVDVSPVVGCGETSGVEIAIPYPTSPTSTNKLYLRVDTNGDLNQDNNDEFVSFTVPPFPGTLTAKPLSYLRVALSWQSAHGQDGYKIQRSGDGGASWADVTTVGKSVTSYSDTGLQCGHPFQYRVQAYDGRGNWGFSNTVNVSTDSCAVLAISAQSPSQVRINLSWSNPYHTPTSINIERSPDGSNAWSEIGTVPGNATSYSDKSLSCAQPYYYRVRAESNYGGVVDYWNYSNIANATTGTCAAPPTPLGLTVQARTSTSVRLNWTDQDDEDQYLIERSPDGSSGWSQVGMVLRDVTTFVDNNLAPGTTYYYRLRALNASGTSGYGDVQSGKDFLYDFFLPFMHDQ